MHGRIGRVISGVRLKDPFRINCARRIPCRQLIESRRADPPRVPPRRHLTKATPVPPFA